MEFPQWLIDRVTARQGRLHPWDSFDPRETAFVVIDMQNFFVQPGYMATCPAAAALLPSINTLATALRDAGGHVIWVKTTAEGAEEKWSSFQQYLLTPENSQRRLRDLREGQEAFDLVDGLAVHERDAVVNKTYYSALSPDSSDLHQVLQERNIKNVLVGGTATNVCCESTARNAMMLNYSTVMVHDALAAYSAPEHEWALFNFVLFYGDVLSVSDVISRFSGDVASA